MSIFSTELVKESWVGMAYELWYCTNPLYQYNEWSDAFEINFSKNKLRDVVKKMLMRDDGSMKLGENDFDNMNNNLENHNTYKLNDEYKFIILICLLAPSLNEENLSSILTSCLTQRQLRLGSNVDVKVEISEESYTFLKINVRAVISQQIKIVLKKK
jgi:hypothetical protein